MKLQRAELEEQGRLVVARDMLCCADSRAGDHVGHLGLALQRGTEVFERIADAGKAAQGEQFGEFVQENHAGATQRLGQSLRELESDHAQRVVVGFCLLISLMSAAAVRATTASVRVAHDTITSRQVSHIWNC